jgi:hypothetical protein
MERQVVKGASLDRVEGECELLYCAAITASSSKKPAVISQHHYRLKPKKSVVTYHRQFKPPADSDRDLCCRFSRTPYHFWVFKLRTSNEVLSLQVSEQPKVMWHLLCRLPVIYQAALAAVEAQRSREGWR